jgi:hypothetical protein
VANAQRLDYVIITEHNTLKPLYDGKQGWHGATLVLIGMELSTRGGHYLALRVTDEIDRNHLTTQQIIDEVNRQGGLGFIAHPYFKQRRWTDWEATGFTGIEAYNVAHDTLDENRLRLALWTLAVPSGWFYPALVDRPYDPLSKWDELMARHGRVVGIGAADAHEFHVLGFKFAPYEALFRLIRTHVLIPSSASPPQAASAKERLTPEEVYRAFQQGHVYLAIEFTAPASGFSFYAHTDQQLLGIMGDEVMFQPTMELTAILPIPATLTLLRDGQPFASILASRWQVPIGQPGVYRLEATLNDKPWIFSNPIYVRPNPDDRAQPR